MSTFEGTWVDLNNDVISVSETANNIELMYSNGRGPFQGFEVDVTSAVINVNFTDDAPFTGVLSEDKNKIFWSNETVWTRN